METVFLLISQVECSKKATCLHLNVSITQKIENLGFHRTLNWLVESHNLDAATWLNNTCKLALRLDVGQGMFVNPDQVDDLQRLGKLDALIDGSVDVEAPAHLATRHTVFIYLNQTDILTQTTIKLPIHLRYQRPLLGGHGKVILSKPALLVHCSETNNVICGKDVVVSAPKSSKELNEIQLWKNLTYKAHFDEMELLVPIGNLDDYGVVAVVSCILGCAGCIYLLSLMRQ